MDYSKKNKKGSKINYLKIDNGIRKRKETTDFIQLISKSFSELLNISIFITDFYTILRIFKDVALKPYFVYCYFGDNHIQKTYCIFLQTFSRSIKLLLKNNLQTPFEPNEYVENSKEIRQLSGPVSFYKLQALDKETRPQYINLFGDRHNSEKEQCKECNFDYFNYYRHKYENYIN